MKRLRQLFLATFAALAFVACSDSELPDGGGGGNKGNGEAWLSIRINRPAMSRAIETGNGGREPGKPNESKINSISVILFDGFLSTSKVTNYENLVLKSGETDWLTQTKAFKVSSDAESILVVVNPSKLPTIVEGTSTFADVNQAIAADVKDVTVSTGTTYDNFMMTNASGELEPRTWHGDGTSTPGDIGTFTKGSAGEAEQARVPAITVDRVVAKVRLYTEDGLSSPSAPDDPQEDSDITLMFSDIEWGLNVTNKLFYPVSKRIKSFLEEEVGVTTWSALPYMIGSYREDPNFDSPSTTYGVDGVTYTDTYKANYNFADADLSGNPFTINWKGTTTTGDKGKPENGSNDKDKWEYCLENTQEEDLNIHAYTTHAVVKAKVYPSHFKKYGGGYEPYTTDEDWIKIAGGYYNFETLMEYLNAELVLYYSYGTTPALTNAFIAYINYLVNEKGATGVVAVSLPAKDDGKTPSTQAEYALTLISNQETQIATHGADGFGNVSYYETGLSYYKIMLKHNDTDRGLNKRGEFGVVRNSVYDIIISAVNAPGYPVIPKPDDKKPDEEEDLFLAVEIEINDWTWYKQGAVLE